MLEREREIELWREARSFDDLCALGARFVAGEIGFFPGWLAGELDEESDRIQPQLLALNRAGLLTTASQPGRLPYRGHDGELWKERPFVCGFVRAEGLSELGDEEGLCVRVFAATETGTRTSAGAEPEPVGMRGALVHLVAGTSAHAEELSLFEPYLAPAALESLRACHWLSAFDTRWEPAPRLWEFLTAALIAKRPDQHNRDESVEAF